MHAHWELLVEHLRAELQGYGGLLQLFSEQQENLLRGDADAVLSYAHEIEAQVRVTAELRERRENAVRHLAEAHGHPVDSPLRQLLPIFAEEVRPLIGALIDEINHLIRRVRRGAQRNHQMLRSAVEARQETLRALRPTSCVKTYSPQGAVTVSSAQPAWQSAG